MAIFQKQEKQRSLEKKVLTSQKLQNWEIIFHYFFYIYELIFSSLLYVVKVGKVSPEYV